MMMDIHFIEFDLQYGYDIRCPRDYLKITNEKDQLFGVYCGQQTGQTVLVTGKYALLKFHSDSTIQKKGFAMYFTAVPQVTRGPAISVTLQVTTGTATLQATTEITQRIKDEPTQRTDEPTGEREIFSKTMTYIISGVASILFVALCFVLSYLCYSRLHHKAVNRSARSVREIIPLDKWELLPEQIEHEEELGRGAFGVVYKATLKRRVGIEVFDTKKRLGPEKACQVVAVKVLQDDPTEEQKEEFLHEIAQMKLLGAHQNIVSLVGCCTLQESKSLVIEYVQFGDLLQWLRRRRRSINRSQAAEGKEKDKCYDDKETFDDRIQTKKSGQEKDIQESTPSQNNSDVVLDMTLSSVNLAYDNNKYSQGKENIELLPMPSTSQRNSNATAMLLSTENLDDDDDEADSFSTQRLFSFAWQIAKGMNHLAEKDFIHRDLAARNILVGSDGRVKVSDFGLMRQIYEDVYSATKTKKLPVKWMAPESIFDSVFTIKSDTWSYGILLWEMATMGGVPYPTFTNPELYRLLKTGYRMERPDMCSDEVYELMFECWDEDPATRPSFSQLIDRMEAIMTRDVPYCDVNKHDESSPYYNVPAKTVENSE